MVFIAFRITYRGHATRHSVSTHSDPESAYHASPARRHRSHHGSGLDQDRGPQVLLLEAHRQRQAQDRLLHSELRPADKAGNTAYSALAIDHITKKASTTQHGITVVSLPFAPLLRSALTEAGGSFTIATPQAGDRCVIETGSNDWDVFFDMTPQGAKLFEDANGKSSTGGTAISRDFIVQYRMELFFVKKGTAEPVRVPIVSATTGPRNHDAAVFLNWDTDPMGHAHAYIVEVLRAAGLTHQNPDALADWLTNGFNVHDRIAWQAEIWDSEGIADEVNAYIDGLPSNPADQQLNALALQLRYLETYNVPLEAYRSIHKKIEGCSPRASRRRSPSRT
ncbi:hypothetical protein AHiyo8_01810 [Arthrobacter sp. Hiyo8]|nr:hypothetical protein AHiyo8_01810 [Arthrobacter sp. Hiyo8]